MARISFLTPQALVLLLVIPIFWITARAGGRSGRDRRLLAVLLRTIIAVCLIGGIAGARITQPVTDLTTVFLVDVSDSVSPAQRDRALAYINEALATRPLADRAAVVAFGAAPLVEEPPTDLRGLPRLNSLPAAGRTDIGEAIALGVALLPGETQRRLVLLSDGAENSGSAIAAAQLAALRGVPIDIVALPAVSGPDALIAGISVPASARAGQEIPVTLRLRSSYDAAARVIVTVDGQVVASEDLAFTGAEELTVRLPAGPTGFRRIEARIDAPGDATPQNNRVVAFTDVRGPPRVLLLASEPARAAALQRALTASGVETELRDPANAPATIEGLASYAAVILVDTPARAVPRALLQILPTYVRELGRGLAMTGGSESFGAGGYRRAPRDAQGRSIEDVLPVSLDPLDDQLTPDIALALVVDRSGSMSEAGDGVRNRLDLAKDAVYQAALGLTPRDQIGLTTFDELAEQPLPMQTLPALSEIERALAFDPGGGTDIRAGVARAAPDLIGASARIKHMILLTDGQAESNYGDLISQLRDAGATISTVAIGSDANPNLRDIAQAGGGRFYQVVRAADLPAIFLQETVIAAGRDLIDGQFVPLIGAPSPLLRGVDAVPALGGRNGVELKSGARALLISPDEKPVLAQWQYGLGRSLAWASDLEPRWGADWVRWERFPALMAGLVELITPAADPQGLLLRAATEGDLAVFELEAEDETGRPRTDLTLLGQLRAPDDTTTPLTFTQIGPGRYRATARAGDAGVYLAQVAATDAAGLAAGTTTAGLAVSYGREYSERRENPQLLADLATLTGGRIEPAASTVFASPAQQVGAVREIGLPLLWLALLLWPLDIALRRVRMPASALGNALRERRAAAQQRASSAAAEASATMERLAGARARARRGGRTAEPVGRVDVRDAADAGGAGAAGGADAGADAGAGAGGRSLPPNASALRAPSPPAAPTAPADDQFARLMAAKQRARRKKEDS